MQWLWRPSAIIRVGEDCDQYGKPYEYAVVASVTWPNVMRWLLRLHSATAELMALVNPEKHPIPKPVTSAIIDVLRRARFRADWRRFRPKRKPTCAPRS